MTARSYSHANDFPTGQTMKNFNMVQRKLHCAKDLGVTIDSNRKFASHIDAVATKAVHCNSVLFQRYQTHRLRI